MTIEFKKGKGPLNINNLHKQQEKVVIIQRDKPDDNARRNSTWRKYHMPIDRSYNNRRGG